MNNYNVEFDVINKTVLKKKKIQETHRSCVLQYQWLCIVAMSIYWVCSIAIIRGTVGGYKLEQRKSKDKINV